MSVPCCVLLWAWKVALVVVFGFFFMFVGLFFRSPDPSLAHDDDSHFRREERGAHYQNHVGGHFGQLVAQPSGKD